MLRLNGTQRSLLAETLKDGANVAAGALIFGQALSDRGFSATLAAAGVATWVLLAAFAVALLRKEEHR